MRLSDLKAVSSYNQHIKYFRGMAEVARKDNVELHNRGIWNLIFPISPDMKMSQENQEGDYQRIASGRKESNSKVRGKK